MKQILITQAIKDMAQEYSDNLFADKTDAFVQPVEGLTNLQTDIYELNNTLANKVDFAAYLELLINEYEKLKQLLPSEFENYKNVFDDLLDSSYLSSTIECRQTRLPADDARRFALPVRRVKFFEEIVARMRYEEARPLLASYMEKLGMQTCVYCNNAEAVYADDVDEAYYHFDHWKPKDKYPFLSVCFYNLYPSCSNCNGHKLDGRKGSFQLYVEEGPIKDPFVFLVDRTAYEERDPNTISVAFNARDTVDEKYCKEYDKVYRIKYFYNSQVAKRQVSKLLMDIKKHCGSYLDATEHSCPGIINRDELFHDVFGVDGNEENIFTDVKKKLKLDTAKDIKLI